MFESKQQTAGPPSGPTAGSSWDDDDEESSSCSDATSASVILLKTKNVCWVVDDTQYIAQIKVTIPRYCYSGDYYYDNNDEMIQNVQASLFVVVVRGGTATAAAEQAQRTEEEEEEQDRDKEESSSLLLPIGMMRGTIVPRNDYDHDDDDDYDGSWSSFYRHAAAASTIQNDNNDGELLRLAMLFCDRNGAAVRIDTTTPTTGRGSSCNNNNGRGSTDKDVDDEDGHNNNDDDHHHVNRGGFFHVQIVSVDVIHKGKDLGLRLLHETLLYLRDDWTLLVMEVSPIGNDLRTRVVGLKNHNDNGENDDDEERRRRISVVNQAELKLARHFARLHNLRQAGRCAAEYCAWYVTAHDYFSAISETPSSCGWCQTKTETDLRDVYVPPQPHESVGVDRMLRNLLEEERAGVTSCRDVIVQMEELVVQRGASLHDSRALFVLFANDDEHNNNKVDDDDNNINSNHNAVLFQTLLRLGADVNRPDEYGNRPLHHVVSHDNEEGRRTENLWLRPSNVRLLLEQGGADPHVVNDRGDTPLQTLQRGRRRRDDLAVLAAAASSSWSSSSEAAHTSFFSPRYALDYLDCCLALLPAHERAWLTDGWMSPRMRHLLHRTARRARLDIQRCAATFTSSSSSTTLSAMPWWKTTAAAQRSLLQHGTSKSGMTKSYMDGWAVVWHAIERIMTIRCTTNPPTTTTPTVAKIRQEIHQMNHWDDEDTSSKTTPDILPKEAFEQFMKQGGRIEFALEALLTTSNNIVTRNYYYDGARHNDPEMAAFPAVPCLDTAFDVARVKCLAIDRTTPEVDDNDDDNELSTESAVVLPNEPYRHDFGPIP